jgi:ferredoxin
MSREQTIWIDRTRCDGHAHCAELLPELIRLDDWGYPVIEAGPVPRHLVGHAQRAVAACPVLALKLRAAQSRAAGQQPVRASGAGASSIV